MKQKLHTLECWMQQVIQHPEGAEPGIESAEAKKFLSVDKRTLDKVVRRSKNLTALERISIYANMYYWRLQDCIGEDFPAVAHAIGEEKLAELAKDYISTFGSTHYNLSMLGRRFPQFLAKHKQLKNREFLAQLASLELAVDQVFDEDRSPNVAMDELLAIPREQWFEARFRLIPALRLLAFDYPVNDYLQAAREKKKVSIPRKKATWVAIYRNRDFDMFRSPLCREQYLILQGLSDGKTLAASIEKCLEDSQSDVKLAGDNAGDWFREWTTKGFFASVRVPGKKRQRRAV